MESDDTLEVLRQTPLFAGFKEEELEMVPKIALRREFAPGELIIRAGDEDTRSLWLIVRGSVDVQVEGDTIAILRTGDYFGEMALLLEDAPRSADVVAESQVTALELHRSHLLGLVSSSPEIAIGMLSELALRILNVTEALRAVIKASPEAARVALELGIDDRLGAPGHRLSL